MADALKTDTGPIYPNRARTIASLCPSSPILLLQRHTFGGFGLSGQVWGTRWSSRKDPGAISRRRDYAG